MKFVMQSAAIIGALSFIIVGTPVLAGGKSPTNSAANSQSLPLGPEETGQPGVECEDVRPGRAAAAPGSAFNEEGKAGTVYAGEQEQNSKNTASVSQYDVACIKQP